MELSRAKLKWLTVWAPVGFILVVFVLILSLFHGPHSPSVWITTLVATSGIGLAGAYLFSYFVFSHIQRQEEEIVRRTEAVAVLNAIGAEITGLLDLERTLRSVVEEARKLLGTEVSALCFVDGHGCGGPKAVSGPPEAFGAGANCPDHPGGEAGGLARPIFCLSPSPDGLKCTGIKAEYTRAHLAAPLRREGSVIGALCVAGRSPRRFRPVEVELLTGLATQAAIAIENARLHERLRDVAVIEERHRIAREMHDGLAQELGYLNLKLGELEAGVSARPVPALREELRRMQKVVAGAYEEVRQAIFGLKLMVSRGLGLVPTLTEYLHEFGEQTGIAVELKIADEAATRLAPPAEVQLIRIIQEALANVRKHAQAGRAWVTFDTDGGKAKVTVQDDGRGFDPAEAARSRPASFGLQSMRERAASVGGALTVEPGQGRGTQVIIRLPIGGQE
ncbi:MAG: GAF domain-containing sensor histidine kinase, partial [candidate division NC10 bacterium]|nr:GAF domain-containing sensor histidine kinase [candidate division NC10 bacterium]MBI4413987.1 GAF domain-containing sensor histidine kinase [candidate division NC10 bacterium]